MNKSTSTADFGNCSGCGTCMSICPMNAIYVRYGDDGFYKAEPDENKCVHCGICASVCPSILTKHISPINFSEAQQYNAYLLDSRIHSGCASGGVAYGLYCTALSMDYKVIGTYYDTETGEAVTGIASTPKEMLHFRGSKYLQSYTYDAMKAVLSSNDSYLIIGTPCQVYGLRMAARQKGIENRFFFVDISCHGVPSYLAWKKYLSETASNKRIKNVTFRDHSHGWRKNVLTVRTEFGEYEHERSKDLFYNIFDDSYMMCSQCYRCTMCQKYGYSDIRIGDLWNSTLCSDGVFRSVVSIGTERGRELWDNAQKQFNIEPVRVMFSNKNAVPLNLDCIRRVAFEKIKTETLAKVIHKYRHFEPLKVKIRRKRRLVSVLSAIKRIFRKT